MYTSCPLGYVVVVISQHDGGLSLIEANEIHDNTLAGVWVTTGEHYIM